MRFQTPLAAGLALAALVSITNSRVIQPPQLDIPDTIQGGCAPGKPCHDAFIDNERRAAPRLRPGKGSNGPDSESPGGSSSSQVGDQTGPGQGANQGSQQLPSQQAPAQEASPAAQDPPLQDPPASTTPADTPAADAAPAPQDPPATTNSDQPPAQDPASPPQDAPASNAPPSQDPPAADAGTAPVKTGDDDGTDTTNSCTKKRAPGRRGCPTDGNGSPSSPNAENDPTDENSSPSNANTEPSEAPNRVNADLPYDRAQSNGVSVLNDAENRIAGNTPKDSFPDPNIGYTFEHDVDADDFDGTLGDHANIFTDPQEPNFNIDPTTEIKSLDWASKTTPPLNEGEVGRQSVNAAKVSTQEGVIVATIRDKSKDGNFLGGDGSTNRAAVVPSHELSWKMWEKQVGEDGADIGGLRVLMAESIQGTGTQKTIDNALAATGQTANRNIAGGKASFFPDPNNQAMTDAFKAMAGTDNVRPFGQMLAQNHEAVGNKVITKIVVYMNGPSEGPHIVMQLGPSTGRVVRRLRSML